MDDAAISDLSDDIRKATDAALVTHWVAVAVTVEPDGGEGTYRIASPNLPLWMQHGLLSYEAAATTPQPDWTYEED